MFDVAFSEILIIAIVALVVIGPEKLPKVARTLGMLAGRMQRYVTGIKADIDRELRLDEVRKLEQETRHSIMAAQSEVASEIGKTESDIKSAFDTTPTDKPANPA
ncbi:MAG TPA: Sec-independent protein translocase protein TatB [Gallionella sp.]|nr:Sec-independent protein translocase protein TatB [Gallionella sp.]